MDDLAGITNTAQSEAKLDLLYRAILFPLSLTAPGFLIGFPFAAVLPWANQTYPYFYSDTVFEIYLGFAAVSAVGLYVVLLSLRKHWEVLLLDETGLPNKQYRLVKNEHYLPFLSGIKKLAVISSVFAVLSGIFIACSQRFSGFEISLAWKTVPGAVISIILLIFLIVSVCAAVAIVKAFRDAVPEDSSSEDADIPFIEG